jgi:hypothetical protein
MMIVARLLLLVVLVVLPVVPRVLDEAAAWPVEPALLIVAVALLPRRRGVFGTVAALWTFLLVYEIAMWGSRMATGEDMVLYDAFQLVRHLVILLMDLYGLAPAIAATVGVVVVTGCVGLLVARGLRVLHAMPKAYVVGAGGVGLVAALAFGPFSSTVLLAKRTWASVELLQRVQSFSRSDVHAPHEALVLERKPDVRVYVLESYGMASFQHPVIGRPWRDTMADYSTSLTEAGWSLASIRSLAPTAGGRSWICDAAVLTGRQLHYQAEYEAVTREADDLRHLPGWFREHGYRTVLARPSDRARPGVALQNRFGFEQTVFFADLEYRGKPIGWGKVPDQYTVGWLEENRFQDRSRPLFTFAHLATSHIPWREPPPYLDDWRDYQDREVAFEPKRGEHLDKNLWKTAWTFRRGLAGPKPQRRARPTEAMRYAASVAHGFRAIVDTIRDIPADRPTLVLIMGDHQPAFVAQRGDLDVPLHIASNDPALLQEFLAGGAEPGWTPPELRVWHASLYSRIVRSLARFDERPLPPLLEEGVPF